MVEQSITAEAPADELDRIALGPAAASTVLRSNNDPMMIAATVTGWATGRTGRTSILPGEP